MTRRALTDPTAVVARRGGAWFIDGVLCGLAAAIPALLLADAYELNRDSNGVDAERHGQDVALFLRDTVVVLRQSELAITVGSFALAVLVLLVLLPGRKGWSPGYLAADVRLVRRDGGRAGVGRALVRTLAWIVDGIPWPLPLVAYVAAVSTKRHQRIGDLLARTYVVDKRTVGRPVDQPLDDDVLTPVAEPEPLPPIDPVAEEVPEVSDDRSGQVPEMDDDRAGDDQEEWWAVDGEEPQPTLAPDPVPSPDAEPVPEPVAAAEAAAEAPDGVPADEPIWDRRNKRYVLWHSKSGRWLAHTPAGWAPFEATDATPEH